MTHIKICGLTQPGDVEAAVEWGADMAGFIHVEKSPRYVDAAALARLLPLAGSARKMIVVQDAPEDVLDGLRQTLEFDYFQFHGSESPETVKRWGGYKVFHMKGGPPDQALLDAYAGLTHNPAHSFFLLDTQVANQRGGTGKTFDWEVLPQVKGDFLVAGGLTPENVAGLMERHCPWGVDVSSGVEREPGRKDREKLKTFIEIIRRSGRS